MNELIFKCTKYYFKPNMFGKNIEFTMNCKNSNNTHTDSEKG